MSNDRYTIKNARIIFRNFAGEERKFNPAGHRNFAIALDKEDADALTRDGWSVRVLEPREEGDEPQPYISVTVNFNKGRSPHVVLISEMTKKRTSLDGDSVGILDWAEIVKADCVLNPYDWQVNGKSGRKAYLKSLYVTIAQDELEAEYEEME